jgi:hypothetical protein
MYPARFHQLVLCRSAEFLGSRLGDRVLMSLLVGTLYIGVGSKFEAENYLNMASVLYMWMSIAAYVSSFLRCASLLACTAHSCDCHHDACAFAMMRVPLP